MSLADPWVTFFDSWNADTLHLPEVRWSPALAGSASPGFEARRRARARTWAHLRSVLGWRCPESVRMAGALSLDLILWLQIDGRDRGRLRKRLRSAYERILAGSVLGRAGEATPVRLPERCYLSRRTFQGEVRDRMPWPGALTYVTDGLRYGVEFEGGRVEWRASPAAQRFELLRDRADDLPAEEVLRCLDELTELHSVLEPYWQATAAVERCRTDTSSRGA